MPKPLARSLILLLAVVAAPIHLAHAVPILDQEHDFVSGVASSTNGNVSEIGQTFTVGVTGTLDRVEVLMFRLGSIFDPSADPELSIYATASGLPSGAALVTVSVAEAVVPLSLGGFVSFDVSSAAIAVTAGDVLAFGIRTASSVGPYFLNVDSDTGTASDYTVGSAVSRLLNPPGGPPGPWSAPVPAEDFGFRTYVDVPEPSLLALSGLGLLAGLAHRARRP